MASKDYTATHIFNAYIMELLNLMVSYSGSVLMYLAYLSPHLSLYYDVIIGDPPRQKRLYLS